MSVTRETGIGRVDKLLVAAMCLLPSSAEAQTETHLLLPPQGPGDAPIAMTSGRLVIAKPYDDTAKQNNGAYVYSNPSGTAWLPDLEIHHQDTYPRSIAVDKTHVAIGSVGYKDVKLFDDSSGVWVHTHTLKRPEGLPPGEGYGASVDLSGAYLAVGEDGYFTDDWPTGASDGAVYVYELKLGSWVLESVLYAYFVSGGWDRFGSSVSFSGDRLAVGFRDGAFVFERQINGTWLQTAQLEPTQPGPPFFKCGSTVALDGNTLAVAMARELIVYEIDAQGIWNITHQSPPLDGDGFDDVDCRAMEISNERIVLSGDKSVWVYTRTPQGWANTVDLNWYSSTPDAIGQHVAVDGDTAACLDEKGAVHIFDLSGSSSPCGVVQKYGQSCGVPGNFFQLKLTWQGCVGPGLSGLLTVDEAVLGATPGILLIGSAPANQPLSGQCSLNVGGSVAVVPFHLPLSPSYLDIPITFPVSMSTGKVFAQAFAQCTGCPTGFASTIALEFNL